MGPEVAPAVIMSASTVVSIKISKQSHPAGTEFLMSVPAIALTLVGGGKRTQEGHKLMWPHCTEQELQDHTDEVATEMPSKTPHLSLRVSGLSQLQLRQPAAR